MSGSEFCFSFQLGLGLPRSVTAAAQANLHRTCGPIGLYDKQFFAWPGAKPRSLLHWQDLVCTRQTFKVCHPSAHLENRGVDELCAKRDDLQKQIKEEEEEKNKIQNDIQILTEKLAKINESLAKKIATRNDYDKTISETEAAYVKIIDSSHTLLNTLQKEASVLKDKGVPGFSNIPTS
ncbi:Sjoegren syndrome nuclear autoantigen 1 [Holothuria leucospilota]|uniref:Sjoegren syndrome nuclear autoantigen 1 n=1 Tax=Holothuria leucospilota TaxID=206669 RepID=A0A9Q1HAV1_HOLLE|nr:Sjoegren syndrome nuclear autoantigen 1 [Holothuria leucospilota]